LKDYFLDLYQTTQNFVRAVIIIHFFQKSAESFIDIIYGGKNMNLNSLFAAFLGGLICGTIVFVVSKTILLKNLMKPEKIRDMSYFGRNPRDKSEEKK